MIAYRQQWIFLIDSGIDFAELIPREEGDEPETVAVAVEEAVVEAEPEMVEEQEPVTEAAPVEAEART